MGWVAAGIGVGGGGDLFEEGAPTNTFATTGARDAYASANANWLANYDAQPRWFVRVGSDPNYTLYTRRGSTWIALTQVASGPRGVAGAPGAPGAPGSDATVNAANVDAALRAMNAGMIAGVRTSWAIDAANLAVQLNALPAGQRIDYTDLDNPPTIPDVSNLQTATQVGGIIDTWAGAAVTGNTETNIVVTYDPVTRKFNFVAEAGGGTPPARTHTSYAGASADTTFTAAEFTSSATGGTLTLPTFTADRYVAFAIPDSEPDLTDIRSGAMGAFNQITNFQRIPGTITINGVAHKAWRSDDAFLPATSGSTWVIS